MSLSDPARTYGAVTPHASTNFAGGVARSLYVGGAGDVAVVSANDTVTIFEDVPAGSILPVICKRVNATGTTATAMVALH
jgi:hypothetical protein